MEIRQSQGLSEAHDPALSVLALSAFGYLAEHTAEPPLTIRFPQFGHSNC
jgi:hypothetical protein